MRCVSQALGMIDDERMMSFAYSAADLFVIPSLQDNLPNTVMEAMACGVPTIGFDVGGIPDMVRPGITGFLTPPEDVAALRTTILQAFTQPEQLAALSINCRKIAIEEYAIERQCHRYQDLYQQIGFIVEKPYSKQNNPLNMR